MTIQGEPFGDDLFVGIDDFDQFVRMTLRSCAAGIDVRQHRAAVQTRRTYYRGGPVPWEPSTTTEVA